ncbi:MAG TPA: glycogen debranching enzyme, partial [Acidothermaceae bacterium]
DTAGYQVGGFPARWSEWNGKYRDDVRDFWRGEGAIGDFGLRLTGSGDIYPSDRRTPTASINFVTAHDGFTLADLTSYNDKHNDANGEDNNDGETNNSSWNCGVEGPTDDDSINELRARQRRNLLGTLLLSAGVPMILGGDEIGRTQDGNNNAYCQDNEVSWYDWDNIDENLLAFTKTALKLRRENPALRPRDYLRGPGGLPAQMVLYKADGVEMSDEDWKDTGTKTLAVALDGRQIEDADGDTTRDRFLLLVNAHHEPVDFTVPAGGRRPWRVVLTTDNPDPIEPVSSGDVLTVLDRSILLLHTT